MHACGRLTLAPLFTSAPQVAAQLRAAGMPSCSAAPGHWAQLLPTTSLFTVAYALLRELARLHAAGALHRRLQPSSVLIDADGRPRLGNWGQACTAPAFGPAFADGYRAPEVPRPGQPGGSTYGAPADMYALGRTLLACAAHPCQRDVAAAKLAAGGSPSWMGADLADLLRGLLRAEPEQRLTAAEALAQPFVATRVGMLRRARLPLLEEEAE
jgi:serine/threonine protein kinase